MAAPYNIIKKSMDEKKTDEREEKKKANLGSRADRSEEIHETPLKRGGNKKRVNKVSKASKLGSDAERKEKVSPTLPSTPSHPKEPNQEKPAAAASVNMTEPEKVGSEQGPTIEDLGPDLLHEMQAMEKRSEEKVQFITGTLPLKPSHQEQPKPPTSLANQLPSLASTDTSNDANVPPTLPLNPSNQEPPKSPSSLSNQEVRQPPCPPLTDASDEEGKLENRRRSRIRTKVRRHVRRGEDDSTGLTSSGEEEGGEEVLTRSRRKKLVRRARAKTPELTSDSEEEKRRNEKLLEKKPVRAIGNDVKVSPTLPLKPSKQEQPKSLSKLSNQLPCPPLTDESDDEKVSPTSPSKLSDQEQPKLPKTRSRSRVRTKVRRHVRRGKDSSSGLTSSSEDEGGEEGLTRSKRKKLVRRARAKTPTLTSDSEEERSKNAEILKTKKVAFQVGDDTNAAEEDSVPKKVSFQARTCSSSGDKKEKVLEVLVTENRDSVCGEGVMDSLLDSLIGNVIETVELANGPVLPELTDDESEEDEEAMVAAQAGNTHGEGAQLIGSCALVFMCTKVFCQVKVSVLSLC